MPEQIETKLPDNFDELEEYDPSPKPKPLHCKGKRAEQYVHESELWEDTMHYYETGDFPERLADSFLRMATHMVNTWTRFRNYDSILREEMISQATLHIINRIQTKRFDPKRGCKVYSFATRVLYNECIQIANRENKRREKFQKYAELANAFGDIKPKDDDDDGRKKKRRNFK